jgi:DNA-directed RNA polymerase sigma subunit (sigma70/sigma32)
MRDADGMTFNEIAAREGVTKQRIWQIYRTAMTKIRRQHRRSEFIHLVRLHRARSEGRSERLATR